MKKHVRLLLGSPHAGVAAGLASALLLCATGRSQLPPNAAAEFKEVVGNRIEAFTVLGGDYGVSGATLKTTDNNERKVDVSINKFGGSGDYGDPMPLGETGLKWQPVIQGSMGYLVAQNTFNSGPLETDVSKYKTYAIQFGGGARFWLDEHLNFAPTLMGMYGHTENDYTPIGRFWAGQGGTNSFQAADSAGIVNWDADTWTIRPGAQVQYVFNWGRTVITMMSDFAYFHTESFQSSTSLIDVKGDSEFWKNTLDVDVPLGKELFGHELHTGGFFSRTEFYDDLKRGLGGANHEYEFHGRLVMDFLGKLWKVKWIGLGASYMWANGFDGWSAGADVAFKF